MDQFDSPESPKMLEITEIIENFIKMIKHLTKLKGTLTNYVWEKSNFKNTVRMKLSVHSGFSNVFFGKNENPEMPEINKKISK